MSSSSGGARGEPPGIEARPGPLGRNSGSTGPCNHGAAARMPGSALPAGAPSIGLRPNPGSAARPPPNCG
eukprot:8044634-Lingulodinium_polyedra.AAC.1